jgi:hypothetical protein
VGIILSGSINQIYDKILKCVLSLSPTAVVGFINGLYNESLPLNGEVIHTATETVDSDLKHTYSDNMITIRTSEISRRFHIEAEISSEDSEIVLKVFDYGYKDALKHMDSRKDNIVLNFPQPKIIYLEHWSTAPDEVTLKINFWEKSNVNFTVPTMKLLDFSVADLDERRMVILLPLYLLKLRRKIESAKSKETIRQYASELKELLNEEILGTLTKNAETGTLTHNDVHTLMKLLSILYDHLYGNVKEFQEEGVKAVLDESFVLPNDRELLAQKEEIAKNLLAKNILPEIVADATKLPLDKVRKLQPQEAYAV